MEREGGKNQHRLECSTEIFWRSEEKQSFLWMISMLVVWNTASQCRWGIVIWAHPANPSCKIKLFHWKSFLNWASTATLQCWNISVELYRSEGCVTIGLSTGSSVTQQIMWQLRPPPLTEVLFLAARCTIWLNFTGSFLRGGVLYLLTSSGRDCSYVCSERTKVMLFLKPCKECTFFCWRIHWVLL